MKSKIRLILVMTIIAIFGLMNINFVYASSDKNSSNLDVVFVLDCSGSMKESDPEEIRTEAIKMFLDMSQTKGNKVGLVAYSENIVREHNLDTINSAEDKERIKDMASNIPFGQKTDTGYGILEGVKLLDSGHINGNKPAIILLSDGKNDPQRSSKDSLKDLENAIKTCKDKGYPIYTIGLNYNGSVDKAQLEQMANMTKGKSYITNTAADLPGILTDIYASNSNLKIQNGGTITASGEYQELKVEIPNANVLEANISMISDKPVEVKLFDPSGKEVKVGSDSASITTSKKYSMLKIIKPSEGQWTLKVKGVKGSNIKVSYIFNYDLQIEAKFTPSDAKNGDKISIESYFVSNLQKITDKDLYSNMKATLVIKNLEDDSTSEVPLIASDKEFKGEYSIPNSGKYELKVKVDGNSFYRESSAFTVGDGSASSTNKSSNEKDKASILKSTAFLGGIGALILVILILIIFKVIKKKRVSGFGRVEINIKDENTGEVLPPQFRNLDGYVGSFTLFDVLGLKEEYRESENVKFIFRNDDSIELVNKSECTIQKSGRKVEGDSSLKLYNRNKITIYLNKVSKSIVIEFYSK